MVKQWRKRLHFYDPENLENEVKGTNDIEPETEVDGTKLIKTNNAKSNQVINESKSSDVTYAQVTKAVSPKHSRESLSKTTKSV